MNATVSTDLLLRFLQATPEQQAAIERILDGSCAMTGAVGAWDVAAMLAGIHREIAEVRKEFGELRSAKQRLEKMLADGMLAFTQKVDATSFKVLCTILAEGDVAKAARKLEMGDSTLRDLLRVWEQRGGAYARMRDVVRWRKRIGRTEKVRLNENLILGRAAATDYPALLSEVLDGLLSMTNGNWEGLSKELAEMLKAEVKR